MTTGFSDHFLMVNGHNSQIVPTIYDALIEVVVNTQKKNSNPFTVYPDQNLLTQSMGIESFHFISEI